VPVRLDDLSRLDLFPDWNCGIDGCCAPCSIGVGSGLERSVPPLSNRPVRFFQYNHTVVKPTLNATLGSLLCALGPLLLIFSGGCARSPQAREQAALKRGLAQMAKKDYARAALEFRNAAQAMPRDAEPYYQMGLASLAAGDLARAYQAFLKAVQLNPKHSGAQLKLAEIMVASRQMDLVKQAATNLQNVLAVSPDDPEARDAMAAAEAALGKPEDAEKRLTETLEKFPSHLASAVDLARLKLAQRDLAGAEQVLQQAASAAPNSAAASLALAQFYLVSGQVDKAESNLQKTLKLEPNNATALLDLGGLQYRTKRLTDADRTYQQLAATGEKRYRGIHAVFLNSIGKQDAALAELEKLSNADPDDRGVRSLLVRLYLDKKRTSQAQAVLGAALKRHPKDTQAMLEQSVIDIQTGQASQAEQRLNQVLHLEPKSAGAHYALAVVYRVEGAKHREDQELGEALGINPGLLPARLLLAANNRAEGRAKAALQICDEAPKQQARVLALVIERNWAMLDLGQAKELRSILDIALRQIRTPDLVLQDGLLRFHERDFAGARADAQEVLRGEPGDVRAANLEAQTYVGEGKGGKALDRLAEIAAARPQSAPLRILEGEWQLRAGKRVEARQSFEAAKSLTPNLIEADLNLARMDIEDQHVDSARQRLSGIATADAKNVPVRLMLARIEEQAGNVPSAIADYRAVLAIDSSNFEALNNLAYHLAPGSPEEALPLAQQAAEIGKGNPAAEDTLGLVLYRKGDYQGALTYVKQAVDKDPTPRRQFHLAMCYIKTGDRERGNKLLAAVLQKEPNLLRTDPGW
jgi:tetratricopeptide (TPR) repeat protein